jgi:3-methyladenine DNA glycosylase AlkD
VCGNLFDRTPYAYQKAVDWSSREAEFVKRAGFALMAWLPVHDKKARDEQFELFFPAIIAQSMDSRNFVRKAVNWALRNIGKRNRSLNQRAIETAQEMARIDSKTAHWIANDALKELTSLAIQSRLKN